MIDRKVYWVAEPLLNLGDWGLVSMMFASRIFVKLAKNWTTLPWIDQHFFKQSLEKEEMNRK